MIFLISSSWVTRIAGVSHWCPAHFCFIKIAIQDVSLWHFHMYIWRYAYVYMYVL
jgi:hypothetical protein